jgi:phage repressor protein C with HTH and peptisase S24 domain
MDKLEIAKALKKARNTAGMTCREVALLLNKSEKTVSAWEHCNGQPDADTLFALCKIYKMSSVDEMLGQTSESNLLNTLRIEEKDLIDAYRQLTTNSKQIVMSVARLELNHIHAVKQGETPIKILQKTKEQADADVRQKLKSKADTEYFLKIFNQSAAAGYGNYIDDSGFETVAVPCIPRGTEFGIRISGDSMQPQINDGDIVFVTRQASVEVGDIGIFIYNGDAYCKQLAYHDNTYYLHSLNGKYKDIPILDDSIYSVGRVLDNYGGE